MPKALSAFNSTKQIQISNAWSELDWILISGIMLRNKRSNGSTVQK